MAALSVFGKYFLFTLLSGGAPLLLPNPYFPSSMKWMHFCKVTSENFIFGAIVAWLWEPSNPIRQMPATQLA